MRRRKRRRKGSARTNKDITMMKRLEKEKAEQDKAEKERVQQEKVEKAAKEKAEKAEKAVKEKEEKERLKNMTPEDRKKEAAKKKEEEKLAKANAPPAPKGGCFACFAEKKGVSDLKIACFRPAAFLFHFPSAVSSLTVCI